MKIIYHLDIANSPKDINYNGDPYDPDNDEHISRWALAVTMARYKLGEEVDDEVFAKECQSAKLQQTLDSMIENGLIEQLWDEEKGTMVYRITNAGTRAIEGMLKNE